MNRAQLSVDTALVQVLGQVAAAIDETAHMVEKYRREFLQLLRENLNACCDAIQDKLDAN